MDGYSLVIVIAILAVIFFFVRGERTASEFELKLSPLRIEARASKRPVRYRRLRQGRRPRQGRGR